MRAGRSVRRAGLGLGLGIALVAIFPSRALAHAFPSAGDFYGGMLHLATSPEMLLPMIALGILAAQQGRDAALFVLGVFPLAIAAGAVLAIVRESAPDLTLFAVGAMAVLGILVAGAWALPRAAVVALAILLGVAIGISNGSEIGPDTSPWRFVPGVAVAGLLVVSYAVGYVRWLSAAWTKIGVRVAGSWIAATGIMVLALKL